MSVVVTKEFADLQKMLDGGGIGTPTDKFLSASYLLDLGATALTGGATGGFSLVGTVGQIIPGLSGFLENGFAFSCLGGQAYTKQDQQVHFAALQDWANKTASGERKKWELLTYLHEMIVTMFIEKNYYSSECSRKIMDASIQTFEQAFNAIDKSDVAYTEVNKTDHKGTPYIKREYYHKGGTSTTTVLDAPFTMQNLPPVSASFSGMTSTDFQNTAVPALSAFATQNNLNPVDVVNHYANELFGANSGINGSWQIGGTANAGGTFGNQQNNLLNYLLIGGGALLLFNTLKK